MSGRWNSNQNFMNPALRYRLEVKNNHMQFFSLPRMRYYNARVGLVVLHSVNYKTIDCALLREVTVI